MVLFKNSISGCWTEPEALQYTSNHRVVPTYRILLLQNNLSQENAKCFARLVVTGQQCCTHFNPLFSACHWLNILLLIYVCTISFTALVSLCSNNQTILELAFKCILLVKNTYVRIMLLTQCAVCKRKCHGKWLWLLEYRQHLEFALPTQVWYPMLLSCAKLPFYISM